MRSLDDPVIFPIEVRTSAADDIPLSTGSGRDNGWIAVHRYRGTPYEEYFHGVEAIMCDDGRPHPGKPHFRDADSLGPTCPEWDAAMAVRSRLDPDGGFRNPCTDRIFT